MRKLPRLSFLSSLLLSALLCLSGCGAQEAEASATQAPATEKPLSAIATVLQNSLYLNPEDSAALAPYYDRAEARKRDILSSPTEIIKSDTFIRGESYTGTAYYISPNGDDDADGLSPETAWQTAFRIMWGDVKEGDAVFFERGGTYRAEATLYAISNVTYSAYGEGSKPIITIVPENSAQEDCWELYYEGGNGEKIWHYTRQVGDVSGIVFDDSSYARRILEWPTPDGWMPLELSYTDPADIVNSCDCYELRGLNEYRNVEQQLKEDLTYLCRVNIPDFSYPLDFMEHYYTGDLYLRCDAGNPGVCFGDIEVIALQQDENGEIYDNIFDCAHADGWVMDNLSLKYYGRNAVSSFLESSKDAVIQNCTVEWGGNRLHHINSEEPTTEYALIGDAVYGLANNVTIRNNYFLHGGNSSTFETDGEYSGSTVSLGSYLFEGNLIEHCAQGIRTYFIDRQYVFEQLTLRDNIILYTGDSMNNACFEEPVAIDLGVDPVQYANNVEVSDNILLGNAGAVFRFPWHENVTLNIHDNVIAQRDAGVIVTEGFNHYAVITHHTMADIQ